MVWRGFRGAIAGATVLALLYACSTASAAFPGDNGKIAFAASPSGNLPYDVYTVNPDGSALVQLTTDATDDRDVAWSPDGKRIAFATNRDGDYEIYVMNANGSGATRLTTDPGSDFGPAWSPDGTKIAFHSNRDGDFEIWAINADGTGAAQLTTDGENDYYPSWSPDGTQIAFSRGDLSVFATGPDIWVMQANGTGESELMVPCYAACGYQFPDWSPREPKLAYTESGPDHYVEDDYYFLVAVRHMDDGGTDYLPWTYQMCCHQGSAWSPDGSKIAWVDGQLHESGIDMSNAHVVPTSLIARDGGGRPSWQPVIHKEFPRPKGATPFRAPLVPTFQRCATPNRMHGPPLAHQSCNPPVLQTPHLMIGSPDSNGATANFSGSVRLDAILGIPATPADEADVGIRMEASDIRCQGPTTSCVGFNAHPVAGADYTGELVGAVTLRITDEYNSPFPDPATGAGPGTVQDAALAFVAPCAQTASVQIGSSCSVSTTADALVPGLVREKDRANWELGQVLVFDGGPDGDSSTPADTHLFLVQGVHVP